MRKLFIALLTLLVLISCYYLFLWGQAKYLFSEGKALQQEGQHDAAMERYETIVRRNFFLKTEAQKALVESCYWLGLSLYKNTQYEKAIKNLEKISNRVIYVDEKHYILAEKLLPECYYQLGLQLMGRMNYVEALANFQKLGLDFPKDELTWESRKYILECRYRYGLQLEKTRNYNDAIAVLETILLDTLQNQYSLLAKAAISTIKIKQSIVSVFEEFFFDLENKRYSEMYDALDIWKDRAAFLKLMQKTPIRVKKANILEVKFENSYATVTASVEATDLTSVIAGMTFTEKIWGALLELKGLSSDKRPPPYILPPILFQMETFETMEGKILLIRSKERWRIDARQSRFIKYIMEAGGCYEPNSLHSIWGTKVGRAASIIALLTLDVDDGKDKIQGRLHEANKRVEAALTKPEYLLLAKTLLGG